MLSLRKFACRPDTVILGAFKSLRILKCRGNGSSNYKHQQPINNHTLKIEVAHSRRLSQQRTTRCKTTTPESDPNQVGFRSPKIYTHQYLQS